MKILVVNGPNLNLLGMREPEVYGTLTLEKINKELLKYAKELGVDIEFFQSNVEGEIVNAIQAARQNCAGIVINPAAYTFLILVRTKAAPLPGLTCWKSTMVQTPPSHSTVMPFLKSPAVIMNQDRKSTRLNSSHPNPSRMPSSA